jgi:predicted GNAT superfamily acetyltransferase
MGNSEAQRLAPQAAAGKPHPEPVVVRPCTEFAEFERCFDLQRQVWGGDDAELEPTATFVVAAHTGGQVIGAFDGETLVGYTLAVAALREGAPHLHSHMTGVLPEYRDRGVGRMLKLFQRDDALRRGIRRVEWTFDPLEMRNAHFNLNRLGAIARSYLPNFYGLTTSPLHRGLPTDRLVAEWLLDSPHVIAALADAPRNPPEAAASILLPSEIERWKSEAPGKLVETLTRVRKEFTDWFARGYAATAIRATPAGHAYVLVPWSDF